MHLSPFFKNPRPKTLAKWVFCLIFPFSMATTAIGNPHKRVVVHERVTYRHVAHGGTHYYFRNGYYYRHSHGRYFMTHAPIGISISVLPAGSKRLHFGKIRYHYYGGIYYRTVPSGYVVVSKPDTVYMNDGSSSVNTRFFEPLTQTVNIKNTNDSETPVRLESVDGKWKGPNGEFYDQIPTEDQLRPVYGLDTKD